MDPTYLPGAPMTSIFEGQPPKTRTFPTKKKGHLGFQVYMQIPYIPSSSSSGAVS